MYEAAHQSSRVLHSRSQFEEFATVQLPALQLACQPLPVALLRQAALQLAPCVAFVQLTFQPALSVGVVRGRPTHTRAASRLRRKKQQRHGSSYNISDYRLSILMDSTYKQISTM
jgi:hypothetical protein